MKRFLLNKKITVFSQMAGDLNRRLSQVWKLRGGNDTFRLVLSITEGSSVFRRFLLMHMRTNIYFLYVCNCMYMN